MNRHRLALAAAAASLSSAVFAPPARAAEVTDVVDAFDAETNDPIDFHIEPTFRHSTETGTIAREHGCLDCTEPQVDFRRELDYRTVRSELDFDFQLGLHRDLELHARLPVVISQRTTLTYADGVNEDNSSFAPSDSEIAADLDPDVRDYYDGPSGSTDGTHFGTYSLFDVPNDGPKRSGLGDLSVGIAWAPFNDERQTWGSSLRLGVDYVAPTGRPAKGDNTGVGRGVHELQLSLAASRRVAQYVEPYFTFDFSQPFAARNGLFAESSPNSTTRAPGGRLGFGAGTELILFDDPASGQHYSFDVGFGFGYTLEGRDYSPISDALATSACNGLTGSQAGPDRYGGANGNAYTPEPDGVTAENAACAWVTQRPANIVEDDGTIGDRVYSHDGITDIEGHADLSGHTGVNLQFSPYVELRFRLDLDWISPHLITAADAGRDGDSSEVVELDPDPEEGAVERNPFYDLTMDAVGRRLRQEGALDVTWALTAAFQF
ncbi:MAG: hypothetical protein H6700_07655 [Myxococcales bacterium]|nr:hypothetical protein [Myxococcales bacterium]